ncbi:hypothetical protein BZA77DRAFT_315092 [Pyronema omphalodes]|nr:hypothetical protein BZA77DRAFT_315092 [Pyronema omphalodes]
MATPPIIPPRPSRSKSPMPRPSITSHESTGSLSGTSTPATPSLDSQGGIPQIGKRVPMYPNAGDVQAPSEVALPGLGKKKHVYREEWEMDDGAYGSLTPKAAYSMSSSDLAAAVAPTQSVSFQDGVPDEELGYIASEHYAAVISRAHSPAPEEKIHIDDPGHGGIYRRGTSTAPSRAQSDHGDNDDEEERQEGYSILAEDEVQKRQSAQGGMMPAVGSVQVPQRPKSRPQSGMRIREEAEEVAGSPTGSPAPGVSSLSIPVKKTGYKTPYEELSPADENEKPLFPDSDDEKEPAAPEPPKRPVQSHHFPSNDVWEEAPEHSQLEATLDEPTSSTAPADDDADDADESHEPPSLPRRTSDKPSVAFVHGQPHEHYTPNDELESNTAASAAARNADDYNPSLNSLPEQDDSLRRLQQPDTPGTSSARHTRKFPSNDTWEDADDQVEEIEPSPERPTTGDPSAIPEDAFPAVIPPAQHPAVAAEAAEAAEAAALAPVVPAAATEPREPLPTPAVEGIPQPAPTIPSIPARPTTSAPLEGVETPAPISVAAAAAALAAASAPAIKPKPAIPARPQRVEKKWPPVQIGGEDDAPVEHKAPPAVPSRPKPAVPVRPGKIVARSGSEEATATVSPTHGHGVGATAVAAAGGVAALAAAVSSHVTEGKTEKTDKAPPPPVNKPKPPVPPRVGGKIAALKKGLDLEGRLRMGVPGVGLPGMMGMKAPSPSSPGAEDGDGEEKKEKEKTPEEDKPLVAASAGRARGPRGRKLPTVVKKEEVKEKKVIVQKLEIAGPWVNWCLDEELDSVIVEVKEEKKEEVKEEKEPEKPKEEPKVEEKEELRVEPKGEIEKLLQKPAVEATEEKEEKEEKSVTPVDKPSETPEKEEKEQEKEEEKPNPIPESKPELEESKIEEDEIEEDEIKEDPVPAASQDIEREEIEKEETLVINPAPIPSAEEIEVLLEEEDEQEELDEKKEALVVPERPAVKAVDEDEQKKEQKDEEAKQHDDEEEEEEKHETPIIPSRPAKKSPSSSADDEAEAEDEDKPQQKPSTSEPHTTIPAIPQRPSRPATKTPEKEDEDDEDLQHPEIHTAVGTTPGIEAPGAVQAVVHSVHTDEVDRGGYKEEKDLKELKETVIPREEHPEDAGVERG